MVASVKETETKTNKQAKAKIHKPTSMMDVRVSWFMFNVYDLLVVLQSCRSILGRKKEKISTWRGGRSRWGQIPAAKMV